MAKSDLLRFQDVRDAYRLIGECRDLGGDPALWQRRTLEGLCRLIGAPAAAGGVGRVGVISVFDTGFDPSGHERLMAYTHELGPQADPILRAMQHVPGRLVTRTRRQLVSNEVWYRSATFNDYHRPANVDDQLTSVYQVSERGVVSLISLHRALAEGEFSPRQQRLLDFFHGELGPLIGRSLASDAEPGFAGLSPRLRQTLACLLEGDSEKQVASRLGLSRATIHQYVTALYRHFSVGSRAQLLASMMSAAAETAGRSCHWPGRWAPLPDAKRPPIADEPTEGAPGEQLGHLLGDRERMRLVVAGQDEARRPAA